MPEQGSYPPELAKVILSLSFPQEDKDRCLILSEKAQAGTLTEAEAAELDAFLKADSLLAILKSKARRSL